LYIQEQIHLEELDDEHLSFFRALGVDSIHLELRGGPRAKGDRAQGTGAANTSLARDMRRGKECTEALEKAREKIEAHGMKLNNIFMPAWEEITLAAEDMDEKIGHWCAMLDSLGRAGIPCLGWNFKPMGNFRTEPEVGRGGARYSTFDYRAFARARPAPHEPGVGEEEMWRRMEKFLRAVMPAAERAGVRMALHPDDPPIAKPLGGVAQICSTLEQFRKILFELAPSPSNAMLFCQGCMTELLGPERVFEAIAEMAARDKIAWVHFRNVRGQLPHFAEVFIDEGEVPMRRAMEAYRDSGFAGPYMVDHTPHFPGRDDLYGRAYAIGYIRALIQMVYG
jgi:mannonate dehydratase